MWIYRTIEILTNLKIRHKLLISYIFVVFLPVLLVGIILTTSMKQMALERAINEASVNVERMYNRINEAFKTGVDVAINTSRDRKLEVLLMKKYESTWEITNAYTDYIAFDEYIYYYKEIKSIQFYTYNQSLLDSGQFIRVTENIEQAEWFQDVLKNPLQVHWKYIYNSQSNMFSLALATVVNSTETGTAMGVLVINLNDNYLYSMLKQESSEMLLINDTGYIVASNDLSLVQKDVTDIGLEFLTNMKGDVEEDYYKDQTYKFIIKDFVPSPNNKRFRIVSVVPIEVIEERVNRVSLLGFSIIIGSLVLALIFILIFSTAISKRIKRLGRDMHTIAMGNFEFSPVIKGKDEIGELSRDLDTLVKSIKELIYEVYEVNLQKNQLTIQQKEIEFQMLANQINPHFLFNALEAVRMKAHCRGEEEIAEVVKLLGKLMRRNLEVKNKLVDIDSEVDLVKSYLEIQKFRFGDKINYDIQHDQGIRDYKILPLIIQPIVENAVIHGLENKDGKGLVLVKIEVLNEEIYITIEDDGTGMDSDRLEYVRSTLKTVDHSSKGRVGLKNIYQRIKLFYGSEYGLNVSSEKDKGTRIVIYLPLRG